NNCQNDGTCPNCGQVVGPHHAGIYVLLTNILMFNLLIAMFSSTYESVHQFSAQHWNYLRYNMIKEYLERSPLAPPFIVFWHVYELVLFIRLRCGYSKSFRPAGPAVRQLPAEREEGARELAKWEHMKAMDYLRQGEEMQRQEGRSRRLALRVIVRGVSGPGALPGATDMAKQMSDATSGIGMELEKKFKTVDSQLSKLGSDVETKVADLTGQRSRESFWTTRSGCCGGSPSARPRLRSWRRSRLEERVRESVLGIFNQPEAPPWFQEAARQAAVEALQQTPVAVAEVAEAAVEQMRAVRRPPSRRSSAAGVAARLLRPARRRRLAAAIMSMAAKAAPTLRPRVAEPSTGRDWRFAPFNFERHQGMRMNVPPEKAAWEIEYPEYNAFDASTIRRALPSITFNQFDAGSRLRRQSLLGRYQLDPDSGAPLNPMGRTGLQGKGLLPRWGPMPPWWSFSPAGAAPTTGAIAPCKRFIGRRLKEASSRRKAKQETRALQKARVEQIFKGYLDDQLNADNAWIEAVVLNIHEPEDARFSDAMLKAFLEPECEEQARWMEVAYSTALRTSHCDLLKTVAGNHGAYF
uniref:Ion_trans domain-containing protein n=1 Tax=Macrostomum lignano TaxID=282301 RepID=A0A1I8F582_9PLAT